MNVTIVATNESTTMTLVRTTTTYTYDVWGRTLSRMDGTYLATYTWLFGDKLKQYATDFPGKGDVAFNYDGLGKRRNKLNHVNGVYSDADWTWYRWDTGWNMIGEYAAGTDTGTEWDAGALTRWYQGKAAHADGGPDSTAYNYYLHDQLGSPRATYNQSKAAVARLDFSAYGSPLTTAGPNMDVGYTGHKWDGEMGTFYVPYRYCAPGQARWLNRDPAGMVDGPNLYQYSLSNPVYLSDLLGLGCGSGWNAPYIPEKWWMDPPSIMSDPEWDFSDACDKHDNCYCECGVSQGDCDDSFKDNLLNACESAAPEKKPACRKLAHMYYYAVRTFGKGPNDNAQNKSGCKKIRGI